MVNANAAVDFIRSRTTLYLVVSAFTFNVSLTTTLVNDYIRRITPIQVRGACRRAGLEVINVSLSIKSGMAFAQMDQIEWCDENIMLTLRVQPKTFPENDR